MARIGHTVRHALMNEAQRYRTDGAPGCYYCGDAITRKPLKHPSRAKATVDHVIAMAQGGRNVDQNRVPACEPCNTAKADRDPVEFVISLGARARITIAEIIAKVAEARRG